MKFGGTSVADSEAIERVISIIKGKLEQQPVVVVSALSKVTDLLYKISAQARKGVCAKDLLEQLEQRHVQLAKNLLSDPELCKQAVGSVQSICGNLTSFISAICTVKELTSRSEATIIGTGEILSSTIIWYAMNAKGIDTSWIDARMMIIVKGDNMKGEPIFAEIEKLAPAIINDAYQGKQAVITQGFVAAKENGDAAVLGRGGSDYTASLIGMAMDAKAIEIWTDVDGVKTADPRRVAYTKSIDKISFEEAAEMAHFGAKVLHPLTIEPAVMKNIPVYVLNSLNPTAAGTTILQSDKIEDGVKSISFKENILLMNIFSTKMIDVSGFLSKVFQIFAENKVSVDLISTSEANISLTLDANQDLKPVVEQLSEFAKVEVENDKSQISIIGKNIVNQRSLVRWAMTTLNQTNTYMISQGASCVNISFVVDRAGLDEVLQEFHNILFA